MARPEHSRVLIGRIERLLVDGEVAEVVLHVMQPGDTASSIDGAEFVTFLVTPKAYGGLLRGAE